MLIKRNKIIYLLLIVVMLIIVLLFFKNMQKQPQPQNGSIALSKVAVKSGIATPISTKLTTQSVSDCAAEINGKPNLGAVCSISELKKQQGNLS